ncbi:hypothetical protein [Nonomuraea endophytica]|uniref:hypothetical protein n=1 Tax=Nonomuraea endophytica TaxID=714136 RepID=UPI0037C52E3A
MIIRRLTGLAVAAGLVATTLATPASAAGTTTDLGVSLSYGSSSGDLAVGGGKVFVSAEDRIVVTNAQGDLTGSITGLSSVYGLAATADGSTLYAAVAGSNQVAEIDTGTLEIRRRIDLPEHPCPTSLALTGERLWVGYGCFDQFQGGFLALDLTATSPTPVAIGLDLHSAPKVVAAGDTLVVGEVTTIPSDLHVYDTSGPNPTPRGKIDGVTHDQSEVRDLALTSDGTHVISAFDTQHRFDTWNTTTLSWVRRYGRPYEVFPTGLAISPGDAYVAGGFGWNSDVTVYDAATGAAVFSGDNPAGSFVTGGLVFSGTNLYALLRGSGDQLHLWRIEDITRTPSSLTLTAPSAAVAGEPLTVTGKLTLSDGTDPGAQQLIVTRRRLGVTQILPAVTTAANGTFTITDTPPEAGDTTYTATWEGDTNHNGSTGRATFPVKDD